MGEIGFVRWRKYQFYWLEVLNYQQLYQSMHYLLPLLQQRIDTTLVELVQGDQRSNFKFHKSCFEKWSKIQNNYRDGEQ